MLDALADQGRHPCALEPSEAKVAQPLPVAGPAHVELEQIEWQDHARD